MVLETDSANNTSEFSTSYAVQNEAPVLLITGQETVAVAVGATGNYDLISAFADPNGDPMTFNEVGGGFCDLSHGTLADSSSGATLSCGSSGFSNSLSYTRSTSGTDQVRIQASDGITTSSSNLRLRFR